MTISSGILEGIRRRLGKTFLKKIKSRLEKTRLAELVRHRKLESRCSLTGNPLPGHAHVEVAGLCNLDCSYCNIDLRKSTGGQDLTPEGFLHILEEIPTLESITFTIFNEALLNPHFGEILRIAKDRGLACDLPTNGTMITEKNARLLLEARIDHISFSIDTLDAERFESLRIGATYDQVVGNLRNLIRLRNEMSSPTRIAVAAIVFKDNHDEAERLVEFFLDMGVDEVILRSLHEWSTERNEAMDIAGARLETEGCDPLAHIRKKYGNRVQIRRPMRFSPTIRCFRPFNSVAIRSDGSMVPCCLQAADSRKYSLGDINAQPFAATWDGEPYQSFRKPFLEGNWPAVCEGCFELHTV